MLWYCHPCFIADKSKAWRAGITKFKLASGRTRRRSRMADARACISNPSHLLGDAVLDQTVLYFFLEAENNSRLWRAPSWSMLRLPCIYVISTVVCFIGRPAHIAFPFNCMYAVCLLNKGGGPRNGHMGKWRVWALKRLNGAQVLSSPYQPQSPLSSHSGLWPKREKKQFLCLAAEIWKWVIDHN